MVMSFGCMASWKKEEEWCQQHGLAFLVLAFELFRLAMSFDSQWNCCVGFFPPGDHPFSFSADFRHRKSMRFWKSLPRVKQQTDNKRMITGKNWVARSGKMWNWGTKEEELDFGKFCI
jgi:hypothetical protein